MIAGCRKLCGSACLYLAWLIAEILAAWGSPATANLTSAQRSCLMILKNFPPVVTGGVYRPLSFVRYAKNCGWSVDVLTGPGPKVPSAPGRHLADKIPPETLVRRLEQEDYPTVYRLTPKIDGGFQFAIRCFRAFRRFEGTRPEAILATGPSFDSFIAAYWIAKYARVPLVLDYRDEWNECPFDFVKKTKFGRYWERRCLRAADAVVFVTESLLEHALLSFRDLRREQCHLVLNGWDPLVGEAIAEPPVTPGTGRFVVSFLGVLSSWTMPGALLQALEDAVEIEPELQERLLVRFIGMKGKPPLKQIREFPYSDMIELIDQVPVNQVLAEIEKSDALLVLGNHGSNRFLPGKIFEYLASDLPLIVFGFGGECGRLVNDLEAGIVVEDGAGKSLADGLRTLMTAEKGAWSNPARKQWAADHTRERSATRVFRVLDGVVERRAT